jgi:hypothetical protein
VNAATPARLEARAADRPQRRVLRGDPGAAPTDVIGAAVVVGRIAVGEAEEAAPDPAKASHSEGGKKGGAARASKLSSERRAEIARAAAAKRWAQSRGD